MRTEINLAEIPQLARAAGQLSDRAWLAVLMAIGILAIGAMMWRFDTLQREQTQFFQTTLRQNTEALTRASVAIERVEARVSAK